MDTKEEQKMYMHHNNYPKNKLNSQNKTVENHIHRKIYNLRERNPK